MSQNRKNDEIREIHVKMSKKIAQLTKVVYQLQTRNEDSEARVRKMQMELANSTKIKELRFLGCFLSKQNVLYYCLR